VALCEVGAELRMGDVRKVNGRPFAHVDVEYPKDWGDALQLVARVGGKETAARPIGGGSSTQALLATLEVFLGTGPVTELSVEAEHGGRLHRVFTPLHWSVEPMLLLLDHVGRDEALLAAADLTFFVFNATAPVIRHDGAEISAEDVVGRAGQATILRVSPKWKAGRNAISIEATGGDGKSLKRDYTFVNLADGRLAFRQKVVLPYGAPGSRSGPFYQVETVGDAVALGADLTVDVDTIDASGWLNRGQRLVRELVGAAHGKAVLKIYEKPHFQGPMALKQEIHLQVEKP
jgi:hypothetical protein